MLVPVTNMKTGRKRIPSRNKKTVKSKEHEKVHCILNNVLAWNDKHGTNVLYLIIIRFATPPSPKIQQPERIGFIARSSSSPNQ